MKKIVLIFSILIFNIFFARIILAKDVLPYYKNHIQNYGIGVYAIPNEVEIYDSADKNSPITEKIRWNINGVAYEKNPFAAKKSFISFIPSKNLVFLAVSDETSDWVEVIYNQEGNSKGWIEKSKDNNFYTWKDFMNKYGRKYGLYFFADIEDTKKTLYTSPDTNAQIVRGIIYKSIKIDLKIIRGNWALVQILDYDKSTHVGWIKWREDNGYLYLFPKLNNN
ncbi:MAG: hypothetical protein PHV68_00270 [Candidatus Gastranaerophilales bacterium]|nr:hypothetical protein [Candidatus Gastranaerophilales bacterium]